MTISKGLYFSKPAPNPIPPTPRRVKAKGPPQQLEATNAVKIDPNDVNKLLIIQASHPNKVNKDDRKRII